MNIISILILIVALSLGSCRKDSAETAMLEERSQPRPIVAITQVIDKSKHKLSWDISHELTQAIRQRLTQYNRLYLLNEDQVATMSLKRSQDQDPFALDTSWIKKTYSPSNEFVAFFELVEHQELPSTSPAQAQTASEQVGLQLNLCMRVRVFDLRGPEARVIHQEYIQQLHHIPQRLAQNDASSQVLWGDEMFEISPLGIAHEKLCQELATRVESYILLNCLEKS